MHKNKTVVKAVPAAAKPAAKKSAAPKKAALTPIIDHPLEGETLRPGHYSVRVSAPAEAQVQVRLDGGEWLDCREAAGFRWFDFAPAIGLARLEVRARLGKGRWSAVVERSCVVAG
ncbi:MAG: hypothetical protein HY079_08405 [Elusimicrobia bacterium]|nr:hypothetical protein [Elusimicrobiota bacterium]